MILDESVRVYFSCFEFVLTLGFALSIGMHKMCQFWRLGLKEPLHFHLHPLIMPLPSCKYISSSQHCICCEDPILYPQHLEEGRVSGQFGHSVVSDSLQPHGLQHTRPPCPSPTPGAYSNSCPSGWWCHPTISSSVVPFSSCLQSFPGSGSFPMS